MFYMQAGHKNSSKKQNTNYSQSFCVFYHMGGATDDC